MVVCGNGADPSVVLIDNAAVGYQKNLSPSTPQALRLLLSDTRMKSESQ